MPIKTPQISAIEGSAPLGLPKEPKMVIAKKGTVASKIKPSSQSKSTLKFELVSFGKIEPNPENKRTEYGNLQPLIYEAVKGISEIDPIRVFPANEKGQFLIDRGHRRYRAISDAIEKGLLLKSVMVPCIIDDTLTPEKQLIGQLSSNAGKRYTPSEMYETIESLTQTGKNCDDIAALIPSVSAKLIKLNCSLALFHDTWLRGAVDCDVVSLSTAMKVAYLEDMRDSLPLWSELKKWLIEAYEVTCKKISEKTVFEKIVELREGKEEEERKPIAKKIVPERVIKSIFNAQDTGEIDRLTLDWIVKELGIVGPAV